MDFLDLKLSEITTDTLNNLSDISLSSHSDQNIQSGGFFFNLFGTSCSKSDKAVLEAVRLKKYDVVEFMIDHDLVSGKYNDENGNTILHYLVADNNPNQKLITKIIDKYGRNVINAQNNDGDTPLITAARGQNHDICTLLVRHGADIQHRNKQGIRVATETPQSPMDSDKLQGSTMASTIASPKTERSLGNPMANIFDMLKPYVEKVRRTTSSETATININESPKTEALIKKLDQATKQQTGGNLTNTDDTLSKINAYINKQSGGGCGCGGDSETEKLIGDIENYFNQSGGAKKRKSSTKSRKPVKAKKSAKRHLTTYSESESHGTELSRIINNQVTDIINNTIEKIKSVIDENKKDFKGIKADDDSARAFKSLIWKMLREKHPEVKSALDIAVKMENELNKDILLSFDAKEVKEMIKTLKEHYAEKQKRMAEKSEQKSEDISATSPERVPSEGNLSETSF
ncbi:ankyrin repeat protein [Klosneuvirus KNV1]|uniref:Ankyrin repeat protein n=1 Tax=Klosneuvirus KNV1 TaxID=1977640 RepID=A0A1V0SI28_9VIRU|nr:ankyrin repeat protein [Klosneuvirus KNV1]